jgi:apolipoprotein N-acyltransferase
MTLSRTTRWLLSLASGFLLAIAFPNYNWAILAWLAVAILIIAIDGASPPQAAFCGWLHGIVFYPVALPWIYVVLRQYGNLDAFTAAGVLALISAAGGVFSGVFAVGVVFFERRRKGWGLLAAPFLWVVLEWARTHLPNIGFPWNLAGYAAAENIALMQLAKWTGIYGLSFLIVAFNALLARAILRGNGWTGRPWGAVVVSAIVIVGIAWTGPRFIPAVPADHIAHLVQTDFPQSESYPANWMIVHSPELNQLAAISINAARRGEQKAESLNADGQFPAGLPASVHLSGPVVDGPVIWPEVPAPFSLQDPRFAARARDIARESGEDLLVGAVEWRPARRGYDAFNSAVLYDPGGQRIFTYDKIHLVPYGEFVPWRNLVPFAGRLTADLADFTSGGSRSTGSFPGGQFGVFICYESIFPAEVRQFVKNGAQLLVNVSNDGWFGRSAAPAQHLLMARVRAVENRRWILRATNNGFTVSVDPYGRIAASLPTDVRGELDAPYAFRSERTPYTRWGDWIVWMCAAMLVFLVTASLMSPAGRKRRS